MIRLKSRCLLLSQPQSNPSLQRIQCVRIGSQSQSLLLCAAQSRGYQWAAALWSSLPQAGAGIKLQSLDLRTTCSCFQSQPPGEIAWRLAFILYAKAKNLWTGLSEVGLIRAIVSWSLAGLPHRVTCGFRTCPFSLGYLQASKSARKLSCYLAAATEQVLTFSFL